MGRLNLDAVALLTERQISQNRFLMKSPASSEFPYSCYTLSSYLKSWDRKSPLLSPVGTVSWSQGLLMLSSWACYSSGFLSFYLVSLSLSTIPLLRNTSDDLSVDLTF